MYLIVTKVFLNRFETLLAYCYWLDMGIRETNILFKELNKYGENKTQDISKFYAKQFKLFQENKNFFSSTQHSLHIGYQHIHAHKTALCASCTGGHVQRQNGVEQGKCCLSVNYGDIMFYSHQFIAQTIIFHIQTCPTIRNDWSISYYRSLGVEDM